MDEPVPRDYIDAVSQGVNWRQADDYGMTEEEFAILRDGEGRVDYPPYPGELLVEWALNLDSKQLLTAIHDYHDRWVWDSGKDEDLEILEVLEHELRHRGSLLPQPGDCVYDSKMKSSYFFNGKEWLLFGVNTVSEPDPEDEERWKKQYGLPLIEDSHQDG